MRKTEVQIANEVMQGKWGIGKDRENRISKAGYDYSMVQSYVNLMIKTGKPIKEIEIDAKNCSGVVVYIGGIQ